MPTSAIGCIFSTTGLRDADALTCSIHRDRSRPSTMVKSNVRPTNHTTTDTIWTNNMTLYTFMPASFLFSRGGPCRSRYGNRTQSSGLWCRLCQARSEDDSGRTNSIWFRRALVISVSMSGCPFRGAEASVPGSPTSSKKRSSGPGGVSMTSVLPGEAPILRSVCNVPWGTCTNEPGPTWIV